MPVNPGRSREDGLADLLIGVLHQPAIEPDLLVRFADQLGSLSREERERVETALRDSPALRDQLRVLRSDELARVLSEGRVSERRAFPSADTPSLFDRLRDFLRGRGGLVLAPLAAAALLAFLLLRGQPSSLAPAAHPQGQEVAKTEQPLPPAPAPSQAHEEASRVEVQPVPPAPPSEMAPQELRPKQAPTVKPRLPTELAESEPSDADYVAMLEPEYRAPAGALAHESKETFVRGTASGVKAIALAPPHTGITTRAAPTLLWSLSKLPTPPTQYELVLASSDGAKVIARRTLAAPLAPGLQRVELSTLGLDLPEHQQLRWSIVVQLDPETPSSDLVTSGWIERIPESSDLSARLAAAKPLDRAGVYASSGVWYDALSDLSRTVKRAPDHAQPRLYLERMLKNAGLPNDVAL